ncbi:MAG: NAD(P) transhydrogenase subunit alpha [Arachnia sp.]
MRVGVPRERRDGEDRVACIPEVAKKYVSWGWEVVVESGAGSAAGFTDESFEEAGAVIVADAFTGSDLVVVVGPPEPATLRQVPPGTTVAGFLDPYLAAEAMQVGIDRELTLLAVEAIPRTTLAQSMDALSSQANLAGYAAVLLAASRAPKLLPMMVTAAGTIAPAKALVLGVGVAGLQAIATAKRLGAVVHAYDIRTDTKEQVESLGGKFIEAVTASGDEGGYAKEVDADTAAAQQAALATFVAATDIMVTTAQIPGRPAPRLVTEEMVASMKPGAVVVDMAAGSGGNVAGSRPGEVVEIGGVTILGPTDLAGAHAADASRMYARNLMSLLTRARDAESGALRLDLDDEIIGTTAVVAGGQARHPRTKELLEGAAR